MSNKLIKRVGSDRWPSGTEEEDTWVGNGNTSMINMMGAAFFY